MKLEDSAVMKAMKRKYEDGEGRKGREKGKAQLRWKKNRD